MDCSADDRAGTDALESVLREDTDDLCLAGDDKGHGILAADVFPGPGLPWKIMFMMVPVSTIRCRR
jgi:hypothetical protein